MSDADIPASQSVGISDGALGLVAGYSALAGLCPLIPVPFVDDIIIGRIHRRLYQKLCTRHDFYLTARDAKILTSKPSSFLAGAFKSLVLWPVKKIVRKVVYVLAVKSCADVAAAVFNEAWLLARTLEQNYVPRDALARGEKQALEQLRDAMIAAVAHVDPQPTQQAMRSAFGVGRELFGAVVDSVRGTLGGAGDDDRIDAAEEQTAPISERIQDEIRAHWSNGPALDAALREALKV